MDAAAVNRAKLLNLCPRCMMLFLAPKNDGFLKLPEDIVEDQIQKMLKGISTELEYSNPQKNTEIVRTCPCCFNSFSGNNLNNLCNQIVDNLKSKNIDFKRSVFVRVLIAPVLDTARITVRTIVSKSNEKTFAFPTMCELTTRLVVENLKVQGLCIANDASEADFQVTVTSGIAYSTELLIALYPEYKHKKKKRKFGDSKPDDDSFEVNRADADSVLVYFKSFTPKDFDVLQTSMINYMTALDNTHSPSPSSSVVSSFPMALPSSASAVPLASPSLSWIVESDPSHFYLLGRYRKYARDVPQAPWTLGDERKGRNSVEEIITEAVKNTLKGAVCKMHPCGREDIDVRCLGNGRPFIMEVSGTYVLPSNICMREIMESVRSKDPNSLNKEGDVDLLMLKKSTKSVWTNMQTVAEEKRKAYRCVCWSAKKIDADMLKSLESHSSRADSTDEEGRQCLRLVQKTPLRVLHRRSLLDRIRYVYNIRTAQLNDHFFLMDITTTAGTYVKEFVHGDLGRTVPSVCSLLNCQADILQLDVVWLFDDFEGGGDPPLEGTTYSYYNSSTYTPTSSSSTLTPSASSSSADSSSSSVCVSMSSSDNVSGDGNGVREEENVLSVVDMSNGHSQDQNHEQDQIAGENIQSYAENNEPEVSLEKESEEIIKMALSTVVESHPSYSWIDLKNMKKIHQKLVEI